MVGGKRSLGGKRVLVKKGLMEVRVCVKIILSGYGGKNYLNQLTSTGDEKLDP